MRCSHVTFAEYVEVNIAELKLKSWFNLQKAISKFVWPGEKKHKLNIRYYKLQRKEEGWVYLT